MALSDQELKEIAYLARISVKEESLASLKNELEDILENTNKNNIMTRPTWDLIHQSKMYLQCPKSPLLVSESLAKRRSLIHI